MIVQPMETTSQLFRDQRYMTRFYTTMSARDMTLDRTSTSTRHCPMSATDTR
jgi:hypothetical protein